MDEPARPELTLDDVDLALLEELEITPPEEKERDLEQLWQRLHSRRAEHMGAEDSDAPR